MNIINTIVHGILNSGAAVMLPIVLTILCLIFRMSFGKAAKAGLMIGIGFGGLVLVINSLLATVQPAINYYKTKGSGFTTVDVGWAAVGAASWAAPFAAPAILLIVIINVVMIALKWTNVLNVDIWNFIHFLIPGSMAWALTGNAWLGLGIVLVLSVINLFLAQLIAPRWQEYYGLTGTTCSTLSYISFAWPVGVLFNKIFDKIPGVRKIDVSLEKVSEKFGFFGDTAFVGVVVGVFLGLLSRQSWEGVLAMAIGLATVLVLLPRMVSVMMEGLTSVGEGAQAFMKRHLGKDEDGKDRELNIGMDIALSLGDPTAVTTTVLMIPLAVVFAFIIPGMTYFPLGLLTGIVYMVPLICMAHKGNLFRSIITSAVFLFAVEWMTSLFAPEATAMMKATGVQVSGTVTDTFFGYSLPNVIIAILHRIL